MRVVPILLTLALAASACAQDQPEAVTQACKSVEHVAVPKIDSTWLAKDGVEFYCAPDELYYGTRGAPDYAAARRCALAEWQIKRPDQDITEPEVVMPIVTLAMIYANGDGTPRDVDMAIRLVCIDDPPSSSWPPLDELIAKLAGMKADPAKRYDFCAEGPDFWRTVDYECLGIQQTLEENKHMAPLKKLMASWTAEQKAAYERMMAARAAFVGKQVDAEATSGTGVGGQMMESEHRLKVELVDSIVRFDTGQLPKFTQEEYLAADKELNGHYVKLIADLGKLPQGDCCSKPPGMIRDAERAWIVYRDAWIAFARVRWPQVSADSWLTLLTRERTAQLGTADDYV